MPSSSRRRAYAKAAGANDSEAQRQLDGRPFEIRIRFGCRGPVDPLDSSWLGWSHDAEKGTLRLRAMPTINAEDEVVTAIGGEGFEAVEGFWIPRPWLLDSVCPAAPTPAPEPAAPVEDAPPADRSPAAAPPEPVPSLVRPRVGIAQFFTESDPRTGRRSARPYSAVKNLKEGEQVGGEGFNLVLSGRLQALPGRRIIECSARGPDQPPDCIVSADFDRVWIETPASREVLAEWTSG